MTATRSCRCRSYFPWVCWHSSTGRLLLWKSKISWCSAWTGEVWFLLSQKPTLDQDQILRKLNSETNMETEVLLSDLLACLSWTSLDHLVSNAAAELQSRFSQRPHVSLILIFELIKSRSWFLRSPTDLLQLSNTSWPRISWFIVSSSRIKTKGDVQV